MGAPASSGRYSKTHFALDELATPILQAATSTSIAAALMLPMPLKFMRCFGTIVLVNMVISVATALGPFPAMLMLGGPAKGSDVKLRANSSSGATPLNLSVEHSHVASLDPDA